MCGYLPTLVFLLLAFPGRADTKATVARLEARYRAPRRSKHRFSSATRKTAVWFVLKPEPFILSAQGKCAGTIRRQKGICFSSTARRLGSTFPPITPRHGSRRRKAPTGVRRWRYLSAI